MNFLPIKTRKFVPGQDKGKLFQLLDQSLPKLKEKDVIVVTSKIISIHQNRLVPVPAKNSREFRLQLIKQEADGYLPGQIHGLTLKDTTLIPYAGIDRTNAKNHYIFWPKQPHREAKKIWNYLKQKYRLANFGVIITDSFCLPLRWGHMGISIGFWGFRPNRQYAGKKDIFGEKIIAGNSNLIDALAAISGTIMGEGNEQTPLLIIRGANSLKFTSRSTENELRADPKQDLYAPLLKLFRPLPHRINQHFFK